MVLTIFVNVLELFERFDDVDIISKVNDYVFRASMKKVVEDSETLAMDSKRR